MNKLMLFSENGPLYAAYMGNLMTNLEFYWTGFRESNLSHEYMLMVTHLFEWHCQFDNQICLAHASSIFVNLRNGNLEQNDININYRLEFVLILFNLFI